MKILLFGKYGQLGWELNRSLQSLGHVVAYDYPEVDFSKPSSLRSCVEKVRPQVVINSVAYTDVNKAESEKERAKLINTEAPTILAEACRVLGAVLIHYSTDYVFDGVKGTPYTEEDHPHPLNVYGQTKLDGERSVLDVGCTTLILRTAWVYSMRRDSYVSKVLNWARNQRKMKVVEDQVSNPTWARALAEITAQLLAKAGPDPIPWLKEISGTYHIAGRGFASRYEWANEIMRNDPNASQQICENILAAQSTEFPAPAVRPQFSALDCGKYEKVFSLSLPDWKNALNLAMCEGPKMHE